LGDIPVDVPPNQNIGGCVPGIPGGVDANAGGQRRRQSTHIVYSSQADGGDIASRLPRITAPLRTVATATRRQIHTAHARLTLPVVGRRDLRDAQSAIYTEIVAASSRTRSDSIHLQGAPRSHTKKIPDTLQQTYLSQIFGVENK